jgi:CBS domain containing-hemolysin-like protein
VIAVQPGSSIDEAIALSASSGLDRLPVVTPEGQPTGLINVLDVLLERNGAKPLNHFMRRIVVTNEEEPAYRIVQRLRAARLGLAAVLDRHQKFLGIVTLEDLVRRLVSSTEART